MITSIAPYLTATERTAREQWLAALNEWTRHHQETHPDNLNAPCSTCYRLSRAEALAFALVERMDTDGLCTAMDGGWPL